MIEKRLEMALFKRIMAVIKEELFDKVVKDKVCCKIGGTDHE